MATTTMAVANVQPPITFTAESLAKARAKFWFRGDIVLLNVLLPFNQKVTELKVKEQRDPEPHEMLEFLSYARDTFAWNTLQMFVQVGIACGFVTSENEVLREIAYQFDATARLRGHHVKSMLESMRMPNFICKLGTQGAPAPTEQDLQYQYECGPVKAAAQRNVIPCVVTYCFFVFSLIFKNSEYKMLEAGLKLVNLAGEVCAQLFGAAIADFASYSPRATVVVSDVCVLAYQRLLWKKVDKRIREWYLRTFLLN